MTGRVLRASINQMEVGSLQEVDGLWSFQYAEAWLRNPQGYGLSPHLPQSAVPLVDGASQRPVQWYFDNLLPEEGQRLLLAKDAKLDAADVCQHEHRVIAAQLERDALEFGFGSGCSSGWRLHCCAR